jgi:hypothetical protein
VERKIELPVEEVVDAAPKKNIYTYMKSYRNVSFVGEWLLNYGNPLVATVAKLKTLPLSAIEDINCTDHNTEELITRFKAAILTSSKAYPKRTMYDHCQAALLATFWRSWLYIALVAIVAECVGIYYSIYIMYLADYIRDESQHYTRALWLIVIYLGMNMFVIVFRNNYIQFGYITSIKMRRTLCAVMFDKVTHLSVESL